MNNTDRQTRFDRARDDLSKLLGKSVAVQIRSIGGWSEVISVNPARVIDIADVPENEHGTDGRVIRATLANDSGEVVGSFSITEDMLESYGDTGLTSVEADLAGIGLGVYPRD